MMNAETPRAPDPQLLETLACDITARPKAAPTFDDLLPALRRVRREPAALVVDFDPSAANTLSEVVEAERLCCPDLTWHFGHDTATKLLHLRVEGTPNQLDALSLLLPSPAQSG